jgi:hypothetical protein
MNDTSVHIVVVWIMILCSLVSSTEVSVKRRYSIFCTDDGSIVLRPGGGRRWAVGVFAALWVLLTIRNAIAGATDSSATTH